MKDAITKFRLDGKVALVTGAASGLGAECAMVMASVGANVVLTDIQEGQCEAVAEGIRQKGGKAQALRLDVTSEEDWVSAIDATVESCGGLDVVVNNAGIEHLRPMLETSLEDFRQMHAINVDGVFLGTKLAADAMRPGGKAGKGGSIINMSSVAGLIGMPGLVNYCSTKGAVRMMSKAAAVECARFGMNVRVNSVHPAVIKTPMFDTSMPVWAELYTDGDVDAVVDLVTSLHPMGRLGEPMEVATAVLFLASDASSFMTGTEIVVDGCFSAT